MLFTDPVCIGIDTTSGRRPFTYAAVDHDLNLIELAELELEDVASFLSGQKSAIVAVNAPSHVNAGLVRKKLEKQSLTIHQIRGVDIRIAEYELRERGIAINGTASRELLCPEWIQVGFSLYKKLPKIGYKSYPDQGGSNQYLETHPHACFTVLLGRCPLPKPTLEGRLQRELVLFENGVKIRDPMNFFEEITRHKLINGILPLELVYYPNQLDALVAAYTAWLAAKKPVELTRLGNIKEGFITLPTPVLKPTY